MSKRPSKTLRNQVFERARHCCEYCYSQLRFCPDPFNAEHIIPWSKDGETSFANLACACFGCNNRKGEKVTALDPLTDQIAPLFHPRQDHWEDHFCWSDDFQLILGLTPTGRATIVLLDLNREGVRNLRELLSYHSLHPSHPVRP